MILLESLVLKSVRTIDNRTNFLYGFPVHAIPPNAKTSSKDVIEPRSDDKTILGISGGSVAAGFANRGIDSVRNQLRKYPIFSDKEIIVIHIAGGGYKQPQQLMALNYLLGLGVHFDVFINLDGFNEVALPPVNNIPQGVFPFFPRNWFAKVGNVSDPVMLSMVGETSYLRSKRSKWAGVFSETPLRYSITLNLLWKCYDSILATKISRNELTLQRYEPKVNRYEVTGPSYHYESETSLFNDIAAVWKRCSLQMHQLCAANGIRYFHFLQPNQYVAGSKIMGEAELKLAFRDDHAYKKGVEGGYPSLIKSGEELVNAGVNFHDLTMVFADTAEPLYIDDCCHFNKRGNEILGRAIGQVILEAVARE